MKNKFRTVYRSIVSFSILTLPLFTYALGTSQTPVRDFNDLTTRILGYLTSIAKLLIGFAVVGFLYGVLQYVFSGGNEEKRTEGIKFMTYGIVGLFVMVSVWGLVTILTGTFGVTLGVPKITP